MGRRERRVNVDTVFLVSGLDGDFNARRIERYLTATWDCGADPVIVLNKLDVPEDRDALIDEAESVSMGVPVIPVSAATGERRRQHDLELEPSHPSSTPLITEIIPSTKSTNG